MNTLLSVTLGMLIGALLMTYAVAYNMQTGGGFKVGGSSYICEVDK